MKCTMLKLSFCFLLFGILNCLTDVKTPKANPYKEDKSIRHSLFREADSVERMSVYPQGVPLPVKDNQNAPTPLPDEEKLIAMRIVDQYRKIFNYLDYSPVDDLITAKELAEAFDDFNWPKSNPEISDNREYAEKMIKQFDTQNKKSLNFVEFCRFMEDLWNSADLLDEKRCTVAFQKAKEVFQRLFKWLDRDRDGTLTPEDLIYGLSRILLRDVNIKEVTKVFEMYDPKKTGKIDENNFMLSIANGLLDDSIKDELLTTTFLK